LLVVGYPDKSRVYPEMVPPAEPLLPPGDKYDKLREFLAHEPTLTFIDVEAMMLRERQTSDVPVYYKTDLHINEAGDLPVVKEIVSQIARLEGRPQIHWDEKLQRAMVTWGPGSQGRFMSPLVSVREQVPAYGPLYLRGGHEPDGYWTTPEQNPADGMNPERPFDWQFQSNPELCDQRLPATVVYGNSFSDGYWSLGLHKYFCFIRREGTHPMSHFERVLARMPPDTKYFIFQYYAPFLPKEAPLVRPEK
jgi:hypothetical protein